MFFNAGTWPSTINDPAEARDRAHRVALHEARVAAAQDPHQNALSARQGLVDRVRTALGLVHGAPDSIACGAC